MVHKLWMTPDTMATGMDVTMLYRQLTSYANWKQQLSCQIEQCQRWFSEHSSHSPIAQHSLEQALKLLREDTFTLACVGEFSRGKTEFINALLFAEYGQRLLPSQPGRTTMCPTEIFFDAEQQPSCVRLLPIETRRSQTSLSSFKNILRNWITIPFDPKSPASVNQAMTQIAAVKQVSEDEARALGFDPAELNPSPSHNSLAHTSPAAPGLTQEREQQTLVEIPTWRHALVNIDHPLLRLGLRILDTPGLNALGNEPELTLNTLQQANALVFLLGIDTGVSRSDLTIWEEHIQSLRSAHPHSDAPQRTLALLNKVDTLWDDLRSADEVEAQIQRVREITARQLRLPIEQVLTASAKQGLLARAAGDPQRLQRSQLPMLEDMLAQQVKRNQQRLAESRSVSDTLSMMQSTRKQLRQQLYQADQELEQLQNSHHQREDYQTLLTRLRAGSKAQHQLYHRRALDLRFHQRRLGQQLQALQAPLAVERLQQLIHDTQHSMRRSWTSEVLNSSIGVFFDELQRRFDECQVAADIANQALLSIYRSVDIGDLKEAEIQRHCLNLLPYQLRLEQLQRQALQFRQSLGGIFNQKQKLISRFISTLMQEAHKLASALFNETELWYKEALAPVSHQAQYDKSLLEQQMLELASLVQQQQHSQQRLLEVKRVIARREGALFELDQVIGSVSIGTSVSGRPTPRAAAQKDYAQQRSRSA